MGNAISALIAPNEAADENERKKKEQLELMMKLADARLDTFQGELEKMFLDRESAMKTSVPGKRALRFERHVAVDAESTVSVLPHHCPYRRMIANLGMYYSREKALRMPLTLSLVLQRPEPKVFLMVSSLWSRLVSLRFSVTPPLEKATIRSSLFA